MKPTRYYEWDKTNNTTYVYDEPIVKLAHSVSCLHNTNPTQARGLYSKMNLKPVWTNQDA